MGDQAGTEIRQTRFMCVTVYVKGFQLAEEMAHFDSGEKNTFYKSMYNSQSINLMISQ